MHARKTLDTFVKNVYNKPMIVTIGEAKTLTEMRLATGLTLVEVGEKLGNALGRPPYTHARISQIEHDGLKDTEQIEALASIYGVPFDVVYNAAKNLRN